MHLVIECSQFFINFRIMAINISNLNFFYGKSQALFDINLTIKAGSIVTILGSSGAGKSTLIRTLNLLEVPQNGILDIVGNRFDLAHDSMDKNKVQHLRQEVGMVFQQYNLWPHLSVLDNLIYAPIKILAITKEEAIKQALDLLDRLKVKEHAKRFPLHLSGGQQQRVAIARALMMKPKVLLFDEPTAALDPEITAQVVEIIQELSLTGITQVVVTHEVAMAKKIATQVIYMQAGKIIETGDNNIFNNPQSPEFSQYLSHS